jgi:hypothetical protein
MDKVTKFIPAWVKVAVAMALGLGTMSGWKRIVVTFGEKIGKEHLTYAQGASAELVAMGTILAADHWGLPVGTTHVLSSGVAGTMAANRSGLQMDTLRNLLLAWVLTLPGCGLLGAGVFAFGFSRLLKNAPKQRVRRYRMCNPEVKRYKMLGAHPSRNLFFSSPLTSCCAWVSSNERGSLVQRGPTVLPSL